MKTIKSVFFILVCLIALGMINWTFMRLLNWTIDLTSEWYRNLNLIFFILLVPFFWGAIWGIFKLTALGLAALLIPASPDKDFSLYTLGSFSLINCIALIFYYWTRDVNYSWQVLLMSIIITGFILDFSASIVLVFSKKESHDFDD